MIFGDKSDRKSENDWQTFACLRTKTLLGSRKRRCLDSGGRGIESRGKVPRQKASWGGNASGCHEYGYKVACGFLISQQQDVRTLTCRSHDAARRWARASAAASGRHQRCCRCCRCLGWLEPALCQAGIPSSGSCCRQTPAAAAAAAAVAALRSRARSKRHRPRYCWRLHSRAKPKRPAKRRSGTRDLSVSVNR